MKDPSPLLTTAELHRPSLDATFDHHFTNSGWKYTFQATLISFTMFFDAQQTFITIFTDTQPKWSCPGSGPCNGTTDPCHLPGSWDSPSNSSTVSEWSLHCAGPIHKALPSSSFFLGSFIGGFALATLADSKLGRKKSLVLSTLLMSLSALLTAFTTHVWFYAALRFVSGFFRAAIGTSALVWSTELVSKKWRERIGIIGCVFFTAGFLSLPIIAKLLEGSSWRYIYLWMSIPSLIYSLFPLCLLRESPRWLFIRGRKEEFAEALRSFSAADNRSGLTESFFGRFFPWEKSEEKSDIFSAGKILVENGWSRRRLVAATAYGFGVGMVYYGMPLALGNLSFDLYRSVALNALSEFPASFLAFVLIGKFGRRGLIFWLSLLSGVSSVGCVLVEGRKGIQVVIELVSFCSACTAFDVSLIYTLELFPTCVRNSAVSMVRQAMVLSGAVAAVVVAAGRENGWVSYGVFGVVIAACGLSVVFLPETKGRVLCDTMEEEERWSNGAFSAK